MSMHMDDTDLGPDRSRPQGRWQRLINQLEEYVRSRTADHWIMFMAGLVIGALLS